MNGYHGALSNSKVQIVIYSDTTVSTCGEEGNIMMIVSDYTHSV